VGLGALPLDLRPPRISKAWLRPEMNRTRVPKWLAPTLPLALDWAILTAASFAVPLPLSAQNDSPLRFPLLHTETYLSQPALGQAWSRVPFSDVPPAGVPDTLKMPEEVWAEVRLTEELGLLFVRKPDGDRSTDGILVYSRNRQALRRETWIQVPDTGSVQVEIRTPTTESDAGKPASTPLPIIFEASSSGRLEYQIGGIWEATLEVDGEKLGIGLQRFSEGAAIVFSDPDADGAYDHYLDSNSTIGLGGRFWTLVTDFSVGAALLYPTDRTPVDVGWKAPDLSGPVWGTDTAFSLSENLGHATVLVFCSKSCFACRGSKPEFEGLREAFSEDPSVTLVSVVTNQEEASGSNAAVTPGWQQVVSSQAWVDFAVSPTPTIFMVDSSGEIVFRRVGGGAGLGLELAEMVRRVQKEGRVILPVL